MAAIAASPCGRPDFQAIARLGLLGCLLLLAGGCTSGKPGTTNRSYSLYAETRSGFARSVHSRAPRNGRAFGLVEITFHPDYRLAGANSGCRAKVRDVGLELVITLPKWRDGKPVSSSIRHRWARFERTVRQHEMRHVRIAKAYAARMRKSIAALQSGTGCNDLARRIMQRITRIKAQHLRAQKRFDTRDNRRLKTLL